MFELEEKLISELNAYPLPLEAKFYVVQAILFRLKEAYTEEKAKKNIAKESEENGLQ